MTAFIASVERKAKRLTLGLAERAGQSLRSLPGAAGALAFSWGVGEIYHPLLWVSIGLFALAADWRINRGDQA